MDEYDEKTISKIGIAILTVTIAIVMLVAAFLIVALTKLLIWMIGL